MYKVGDEAWVKVRVVDTETSTELGYKCKVQFSDSINNEWDWVSEETISDKTYEMGLSDAWELAKKIYALEPEEREKMLGYQSMKAILEDLTPEYVMDKIEAYEKEKEIKVGDVVGIFHNGGKGVVVRILAEDGLNIVLENGLFYADCSRGDCVKTGKHIDIESLLKEIGE